jgi:glycosyltransferase involved in cell wall biosynthesis
MDVFSTPLKKQLLIIGAVWPEPNSTAAGTRMLQLIRLFLAAQYRITFASASAESSHRFPLEDLGVTLQNIELNHTSFDVFVEKLKPDAVLFDRFAMEEQFGWRVAKKCPEALRILDTEDLHCLRSARQQAVKVQKTFELTDMHSDIAFREIASIYRCDLSLMISSFEMELLENHFKVPKALLHYLPFLVDRLSEAEQDSLPIFSERQHFVTIGNFRHAPNWDSVLYLKQTIWPLLRKELPQAEMHVYGSYPPEKALQLQQPKEGFYVKGWAKDAKQVLRNSKVCLAPLRFGAGLKGKFMESMCCGTPSVTTAVGAEGMCGSNPWGGEIADTPTALVSAAIALYTDSNLWRQAQENGFEILNKCFERSSFESSFAERISALEENLHSHRKQNFYGALLQHHSMRSTEYLSRWIAEKNK